MSLQIVEDLSQRVIEQQNVVDQKQKDLAASTALIKEYQRQAEYHHAQGNEYDLQVVNGRLTAAYQAHPTFESALQSQTLILTSLKTQLSAAKASLTPQEKDVAVIQEQTRLKNVELKKATIDEKKNKNIYIIIVVVVVIIVFAVIYFKLRKK